MKLLSISIGLCVATFCLSFSAQGASEHVRQAGKESVIVFVHGVTGNATSTWTNEQTHAYWPHLVASDPVFRGEDVFIYDYPSPKFGTSYNINELAEDLRLTLSDNVVAKHRRLIFLVHSMGGLVVRQYLLKYRDVAEKVAFIYFYATPTTGSPMAILASVFSRNPQLGSLRPMNVDQYLGNLQRDWLAATALRAIPSFCAYEMRDTFGFRIVGQDSATNLCNRRLDSIEANHIDIVKPEDSTAKSYRTFKSAYVESLGVLVGDADIGLRAELENVQQVIALQTKPPETLKGEPVFCDSMKLSLVLAHTGRPKAPILINSITVNSSPLDVNQLQSGASCKVDELSSVPHGIIEKNVFSIDLGDRKVIGRYIKDANTAVAVEAANLLASRLATRAITLKPDEEPVGLDILVRSVAKEPRVLTFTISYDQDGERRITTRRLVVWK